MFEHCILRKVVKSSLVRRAIPNYQFGFRLQHSGQLQMVVEHILDGFQRKQYTVAAYLDISQAFDRVWHERLLAKIEVLLNPQLFELIKSFVTERTLCVVKDGCCTSSIKFIK
ncbi:GL20433 [Drosophila persimilis]|uniref:GL20433 n=1 Tax=Drosophila persimilis TaxID=7234 RepID=B4HBX0_DROPE|nr:GL20433 [Drosophila persimilis]